MKKDFSPKSRKDNLVIQELDGEVLIYDLQNDKAFCLNVTSALVWQACNGDKSVAEISDWVGEKLNTANNEDLVWLALDQLKKQKLIEDNAEVSNYFEGLSRREVIKKIGLGSMIALPIVTSLIAPTAAYAAASTCGPNDGMICQCPAPASCMTNNPGTAAPSTPCPGTGGGGTTVCTSTLASCLCQGPFVCTGVDSVKQGTCA